MKKIIAVIAMVLCFCAECGAVENELTVSAAASLANAFTDISAAFMEKYPRVRVNANFAASNPLLRQILAGAPVDVFASADQETMDKAADEKVIDPASRRDFAVNDLVLIVRKGMDKPRDLSKLQGCKTIAIGDPASVPAGRYAKSALLNAGLWEELQRRFVPAASVRQALDYVARGEVDCGFGYRTDALQGAAKVEMASTVAKNAVYPIAICHTGQNHRLAREFVDFILSPEGQAILAKYGFQQPAR